jgi:hypothetical protein
MLQCHTMNGVNSAMVTVQQCAKTIVLKKQRTTVSVFIPLSILLLHFHRLFQLLYVTLSLQVCQY